VVDSEFAFELRVCQWAEDNWPPTGTSDAPAIVARQLGTKRRRWDTIVVECDPAGLRRRARFGEKRLDSDLLDIVPHAPAEWEWYRDALPDPGYPGSTFARRSTGPVTAVSSTPARTGTGSKSGGSIAIPTGSSASSPSRTNRTWTPARRGIWPRNSTATSPLGLADEVWVATAATGETVEPILLEDLPVDAGVLTLDVDADEAETSWHPRTLAVDEPGTQILENPSPSEHATTAGRFEYAEPPWKAQKRLEIAERAYERGWRSFADTMRPDCRHFELRADETGFVPHCTAKGRTPTASECRHACPSFEPEPQSGARAAGPSRAVPERYQTAARGPATSGTAGAGLNVRPATTRHSH